MIHIDGLTRRQVKLLDIIWNIDSMEECQEYIMSLSEGDQMECQTLVKLLAIEVLDQSVDRMDDWAESRQVLEKFR
jgi:hypothetical protein